MKSKSLEIRDLSRKVKNEAESKSDMISKKKKALMKVIDKISEGNRKLERLNPQKKVEFFRKKVKNINDTLSPMKKLDDFTRRVEQMIIK